MYVNAPNRLLHGRALVQQPAQRRPAHHGNPLPPLLSRRCNAQPIILLY